MPSKKLEIPVFWDFLLLISDTVGNYTLSGAMRLWVSLTPKDNALVTPTNLLINNSKIYIQNFFYLFYKLLIRNRFWFGIESTNDSQMSEWRFPYLWLLIRFDFDSLVNHDSRVNRDSIWIKMNKITSNRKSKLIKIRINCESKWIKNEIKVNQNESESKQNDSPTWIKNKKKKIFIREVNQNLFLWFLMHFGVSKIRESKWIASVRAMLAMIMMLFTW